MDKRRAIELLKQALTEIPHLRELHHDNQEFILWFDRVRDVIKAGLDEDDQQRFPSSRKVTIVGWPSDDDFQNYYLNELGYCETALKSIIQKYEVVGFEDKPATAAEEPAAGKAFIAHGGKSAALSKLHSFLEALGVEPLVVEIRPSEGRLTEEQVDEYMKQADCAIILATYGHIEDVKTRRKHPRLNVVDELGRCRKVFPDRTILLLEKGVDLPSNISGIVYGHFTKQNMENAFIKVARELRAFGLIKSCRGLREANV